MNEPAGPGRDDTRGYYRRMQAAVEELLILKGVVTAADVDRQVEAMASRSPERGARLVARAWVDPAFKARALADGAAAAEELGLEVGPLRLIVVENTPDVHNVIVCTLCSCYPRMLLGIPPEWYKSRAYRSRVVRDPRDGARRVRDAGSGGRADPRPRFHRRHALHRAADAARRDRRLERGAARGARHPRQPDRRRAPARRRLTAAA